MHRVRAERGVDGALLFDADRHGQGAAFELEGEQSRLFEAQAGDDAVRLSTAWTVGAEICCAVEEDAQRLADQARA